jgi:hypothetical protein
MVEAIVDIVEGMSVEAEADVAGYRMVDINKDVVRREVKKVYPTAEEELIDFLN